MPALNKSKTMISAIPGVLLLTIGRVLSLNSGLFESILFRSSSDYFYASVENLFQDLTTDPTNNNDSIQYLLYTHNSPDAACYIEPTPAEFYNCSFDPTKETKILVHGFIEILQPGSMWEVLKDALLEYGKYNIIKVNWTLYNKFPFYMAVINSKKVGKLLAEMINFIVKHTGADPQAFHCIGHSLGAHVCGFSGREAHLGRITGLDVAVIPVYQSMIDYTPLNYTDADFVDVIHTSSFVTGDGYGVLEPKGHIDFYVNGGSNQKPCEFGRKYTANGRKEYKVATFLDQQICNHVIVIEYFMHSVRGECEFLATKCSGNLDDRSKPIEELCPWNSNQTVKMGFHCKKMRDLSPNSAYYLETLKSPPYCKVSKK